MSISTLTFNTQTRASLQRLQGEVADLTLQVNNLGRINDVGRALGRLTGSAISARSVGDSLKEQQTSNGIIDRRLQNVDAAMTSVSTNAQALANNLIGVSVGKDWANIVQQAQSGLSQMTAALNLSDAGSYVFGGIQTDKVPLPAGKVADAKAATKASFDAFVLAATGGTDASLVTDTQMTAYLTTGFPDAATPTHRYADLFADAAWSANWSDASSDKGQSRISGTETVTGTASANDPAFRSMASAYTMLSDLGIAGLNDKARAVVVNTAATTLKQASNAVTSMQAEIGTTRKRIETSNAELLRQQDIMTSTVSSLEEEDVTSLGVRLNTLQTQLQTAYAVTGKIQKLSLLDYL